MTEMIRSAWAVAVLAGVAAALGLCCVATASPSTVESSGAHIVQPMICVPRACT
ncbi:hypothetical protein [Kutzneria sp. NPDC052558]|uniref:hypothetical protein n=1 Tax=Kutzneria sp. NPDC052558 TaxID=3364121 RepID=UPI0037C5F0C0